MKKLILASCTVALLSVGATTSIAADDAISMRKAYMDTAVKNAARTLGGMAGGKVAFDAAAAHAAAMALQEAGTKIPALFEENTVDGDTTASPAIWENKAEFDAIAADLGAAGMALSTVASVDDIRANIGAMGGTCKGCHTKFRVKKE